MSEPVKIAIIMEGGLVQQVITAGIAAEVMVIDYDIEGADEDRLTTLDEDGPAYLSCHVAGDSEGERRFVLRAFDAFENGGLETLEGEAD